MAFNWQTFKTRTLTASVFVVVMVAGLLINRWTFLLLFSVILFGCWWEYLKLVEKIYKTQIDPAVKYVWMLMGYVIFLLFGYSNKTIFIGWPIVPNFNFKWALYILALICIGVIFFQNKKIPIKAKWFPTSGLLYISLSLGLMINLYSFSYPVLTRDQMTRIYPHDTKLILPVYFIPAAIIASLWINDTMAYIIGSLIGRTQMSTISPKKTWEGTIGGVLLSAMIIFLLTYFAFHFGVISYFFAVLAIIASVTGTLGDFFESKLKRIAGVKDSGRIMPGHGGFLDRFDSLLFAIPAVWLFVYFFMR
jgi:phosphatidate cytidylyltransferase